MKNFNTLVRNIAANSLTMGVMLLFQLLSVPIFLKFWGVELYGEWLTLNTLTAYFQMTDVGLNTATGNSFTFHYVNKDYKKCTILINNNIFFILIAFSIIFSVLIGLIGFDFFTGLFHFKLITPRIINICLILLFLQVLIGTFNNLLNTFYIATGKYARGIMIDNVIRMAEYIVLLAGVVLRMPIQYILSGGVTVKIIGIIYKYLDSRKFYKLELSLRHIRRQELKEIILPALSFFSFPVANSIIFQGVTLLVNFFLGSIAVVIFNTTRTLVNFCKSFIDILHKSIWPELSLAYGKKDLLAIKKLHRRTVILSFALAIITSLILLIFGKYIYLTWTKHRTIFDPILFYLLLLCLLTNTIWSSSNILLQATNNHKVFSLLYLLSTMASLAVSILIIRTTHVITYLPLSLLMIDCLLILYVVKTSLRITEDTFHDFKNGLLNELNFVSRLFRFFPGKSST